MNKKLERFSAACAFPGGGAATMAPEAPAADKKLTLKSSDGEVFEVEEKVAMESQVIKFLIEDDCAADVIPVFNVTSEILAEVIEFCKKLVEIAALMPDDQELPRGRLKAKFVKLDLGTGVKLIKAADYLNITSLLDLTCHTAAGMLIKFFDNNFARELLDPLLRDEGCANYLFKLQLTVIYLNIKSVLDLPPQTVADIIKGKSLKEIWKTFNIKNCFTSEEEAELEWRRPEEQKQLDLFLEHFFF